MKAVNATKGIKNKPLVILRMTYWTRDLKIIICALLLGLGSVVWIYPMWYMAIIYYSMAVGLYYHVSLWLYPAGIFLCMLTAPTQVVSFLLVVLLIIEIQGL